MVKLQQLRSRTIFSALTLFSQNGFIAILGFATQIVLTSYLSPKIYGIYAAVISFMAFFNYFSDIGLSAFLVQKKAIDQDDIKTVFTVQQIIVIILCILGFLLTDWLISLYNLPSEATQLYWIMLIAFFLSSWRSIPTILLEREMKLYKLASIQIVENSLFQILVIVGIVAGWGLLSFALANLVRSVFGLISIYIIAPWKVTIGIVPGRVRQLFGYGVPMQLNSILALMKDDLMNLALGQFVGLEALGYITWAKKWAEMPIRMVLDSVNRVLFSLFSRLKDTKHHLRTSLEKMLHYQSLTIFPLIVSMILLMDTFVKTIPNYNKWLPALPLFYMFCIATTLSASPFTNLFNAVGKVKWTLRFMILWTVLTWILVPILSLKYGMYGFPLTQLCLTPVFFLTVHYAKRLIEFHFWRLIYKPFLAAILMIIPFKLFKSFTTSTHLFQTFAINSLLLALSYYLILRLIFKLDLIEEIKIIKHVSKS